jgi:hypothetical protein
LAFSPDIPAQMSKAVSHKFQVVNSQSLVTKNRFAHLMIFDEQSGLNEQSGPSDCATL